MGETRWWRFRIKEPPLLRRFNQQGETLIAAYQRQRQNHVQANAPAAPAAQNNLVFAGQIPADCDQGLPEDEEEIHPVFVQAVTTDEELFKIFAVTRSSDRAPRPAPYSVPATRNQPATRSEVKRTGAQLESIPMDGPTSIRVKQEAMNEASIPEPVPADPIELRVDFSRDDVIMEDDIATETVLKANHAPSPPKMSKKPGPRQSAVSSHVNPQDVVNAILNSPVTLSTGQIMAVSPAIANAIIEVLKLKNAPRPAAHAATVTVNMADTSCDSPSLPFSPENIVGATFVTKDRQRLIQLQVEINGKTVVAIVDTGSMLNVASRNAWRTYLTNYSMDVTKHINMGDANGGQSQLRGYLKDVLLLTGGVESRASFWIGDKVPFEILLGRPWQRGNFVSIDERKDGTYLVFRDPETGGNRHELLVDDDDDLPTLSMSLAQYHTLPMPGAYMMQVVEPTASESPSTELNSDDSLYEGYVSESQADLEREIFGSEASDSDEETIITSPHSHPPCSHTDADPKFHSPYTRSPLCATCEVLLRENVFQKLENQDSDVDEIVAEGNALISAAREAQQNENPNLQDISVHTFYTGFQKLENWETLDTGTSPERVQASSDLLASLQSDPVILWNFTGSRYLETKEQRSNLHGFLRMHPELIWLATQLRLTPNAFLKRTSDLLRAHDLHFGDDGHLNGFTEAETINDSISDPRAGPNINVLGTNPFRFFAQFDGSANKALVTEEQLAQIRTYLGENSSLIPHSIHNSTQPLLLLQTLLNHISTSPAERPLSTMPSYNSFAPSFPQFLPESPRYIPGGGDDSDGIDSPAQPYTAQGNFSTSLKPVEGMLDETNHNATTVSDPEPAPQRLVPDEGRLIELNGQDTTLVGPDALNMKRIFDSSAGSFEDPYILDSPPSSPAAKRPRLLSPAPSVSPPPLILSCSDAAVVEFPPPGPMHPISWILPTRASGLYSATRQSVEMAMALSFPYVADNRFEDDPRLSDRNRAHRDNQRFLHLGALERYCNVGRPGFVPVEGLHILAMQAKFEHDNGVPETFPPGFRILQSYLNLTEMPHELSALHDHPDYQSTSSWLIVHRLLYEIMSTHRNGFSMQLLKYSRNRTPFHLQCIPYSPDYVLGHGDPLTTMLGIIRAQIVEFIANLRRLHYGFHPAAVARYDDQVRVRIEYGGSECVPQTYLFSPVKRPTPVLPADREMSYATWHPLIFKFERDFLIHCIQYFSTRRGPVKHLSRLAQQLLYTRFTHHVPALHMLHSGMLADVGEYQLYANITDGDDSESELSSHERLELAQHDAGAEFDLSLYISEYE
ncbi:hypothetical protein C8R47DRAFT_1241016 [Mycena vitilis]|nr:hypothetical protein C8R47DRAFT_1241016 [Mycena vitilis]